MQALHDDERVDVLEKKIDKGFAETRADSGELRAMILSSERGLRGEIIAARSDARADFRTLISVVFALWAATALAVVGVLAAHL
jgi:hypothetical protein